MPRVRITVKESRCRSGYHYPGQEFIVDDLCPPLCHELWQVIYPSVYTLKNGGLLDYGDTRAPMFSCRCPDEGRVIVVGEVMPEE